MSDEDEHKKDLLEKEGRFWDLQEEAIDSLYARPHDWRFMPDIAEKIIKPKIDYLKRVVAQHRQEISSLLDIGCGNGWFCHACAHAGIRTVGVDLSVKKIETARRMAKEQGIDHLCRFEACDVMEVEVDEKVDLLTAFGSLHHFPDLETELVQMVDRFLRPDGYMLFMEPHYEGMSPGLQEFVFKAANSRLFGSWFDKEFYLEVTGQESLDQPAPAPAAADGFNLRGESPAGLEFLGEEPDMGEILKERFTLLDERFFHYMSGHLTNALYVYMKPRLARGLYRVMLPIVVALDTWLCKKPSYSQYAEEGSWFLKR